MAINPKQMLKDFIDDLSDEEARELLQQIRPASHQEVDLQDLEEEYEDIKRRFEDAFRQLSRS